MTLNNWLSGLFQPRKSGSLSKVCSRSGSRLASHEQQPYSSVQRCLSPSNRGDERDNLFLFSPHFLFLLPVQTCRLLANCRAEALEETLQSLTCLHNTFIGFNKNKSHVFSKPQKAPGDCSSVRATFIMSFLQMKSQLFGLRGHSGSFIVSAVLFISI